MRSTTKLAFAFLLFLWPARAHSQSIGQIDCARQDDYVYLYTSMTTLEVRATLQCHEQVEITGRYDKFVGVRTAKGEIGFVPLSSVLFLKDQPGVKPVLKPAPSINRERIAYDPKPAAPTQPAPPPNDFTLANNTPVHLKIDKTISSVSAHVGDSVELEVLEDVSINGIVVIAKGAPALATVSEAQPKKRMGRSGKLGITFKSTKLVNDETVPIRGYQEVEGSPASPSASVNPLASGKDTAFLPGTEFTALVDGNLHLNRDTFANPKPADPSAPATPATPKPPQ